MKYISKQHLQRYPYIGYKLCTQCQCVGTKNSPFTEKQVSWNLRIEIEFLKFRENNKL